MARDAEVISEASERTVEQVFVASTGSQPLDRASEEASDERSELAADADPVDQQGADAGGAETESKEWDVLFGVIDFGHETEVDTGESDVRAGLNFGIDIDVEGAVGPDGAGVDEVTLSTPAISAEVDLDQTGVAVALDAVNAPDLAFAAGADGAQFGVDVDGDGEDGAVAGVRLDGDRMRVDLDASTLVEDASHDLRDDLDAAGPVGDFAMGALDPALDQGQEVVDDGTEAVEGTTNLMLGALDQTLDDGAAAAEEAIDEAQEQYDEAMAEDNDGADDTYGDDEGDGYDVGDAIDDVTDAFGFFA